MFLKNPGFNFFRMGPIRPLWLGIPSHAETFGYLAVEEGGVSGFFYALPKTELKGKKGVFKLKNQKELEKKVLALELANKSYQTVNRIMLTFFHDIKSPLMGLVWGLGNLDFLVKKNDFKPKILIKTVSALFGFVDRIQEMIRRGAVLARKENLSGFLIKSRTDVLNIIVDALSDLEDSFKKGNIEVIKNFPKNPVYVYGDSLLLVNCFKNLLENAVKAYSRKNKKSGIIKIKIEHIKENCLIKIQDNAAGIAQDDIDGIFKFGVKPGGKRNLESFGAGLWFVKKVIEGHQGEVKIESQVEKGTLFTVSIPEDHHEKKLRSYTLS